MPRPAAGQPVTEVWSRVGPRPEQVADAIRDDILRGRYRPGDRLVEPELCTQLQISRNTLREGFRILTDERLVVHRLNQGISIRVPTVEDVYDIYRCRRIIECAAVRETAGRHPDLSPLARSVDEAERMAGERDWVGVGTADVIFHQSVTALVESPRISALVSELWNELRLVFLGIKDAGTVHQPYVHRNREIYQALVEHDPNRAEALLAAYLDDAERHILSAYLA